MAMLRALVENAATPEQMAELARGKLRRKLAPLARALEGRLTEHHRFVLDLHLRRMAAIEADLAALDARIEAQMEPSRAQRSEEHTAELQARQYLGWRLMLEKKKN